MTARPLVLDTARLEQDSARTRTRWSMGTSTVLHIIAMLLLTAARPIQRGDDEPVEVTLLDTSGMPAAAAAAAPAAAPAAPTTAPPVMGAVDPSPSEQRFRRQLVRADLSPSPQSDLTVADRISQRLAAMRESNAEASAGAQLGAAPSLLASNARVANPGTGTSAIALHRQGGSGGSGLSLDRGSGGTSALGAVAPAPAAKVDAAEAPHEERAARRAAGADLMGPIADRRILRRVTPVYPEWAKRDGVEGSVSLYFVVRADGTVKENVLIQKTAGFGDFDENARAALREWRFEPLAAGEVGEQWGTITLNYRLRGQ
jgi:TonB family protein